MNVRYSRASPTGPKKQKKKKKTLQSNIELLRLGLGTMLQRSSQPPLILT
jgi:hypothetical protein